jgi:PAS domain S-box-containing protein
MGSSSHADGHQMAVSATGRSWSVRPEERLPLTFLGAGAILICALLALAAAVPYQPSVAALGEVTLLAATMASAAALWSLATTEFAWRGTRWAARSAVAAVVFQLALWLNRFWNGWPKEGGIAVRSMVFVLAIFVAAAVVDFFEHFARNRAEVLSDALVVAVVAGGAAFLLLQGADRASVGSVALTTLVAVGAVVALAGWTVLNLWCPTPVHFALLCASLLAGGAALVLGHAWRAGPSPEAMLSPEVAAALSILAFTGVLVVEPRLTSGRPAEPRAAWWLRPSLLAVALGAAFAVEVFALVGRRFSLSVVESIVLASVVFATIAIRSLVHQVDVARGSHRLEDALRVREEALTSFRDVAETLSRSEAKHRQILDAAVDGIVELDADGQIVRVNEAFCSMVHMTPEDVVGRKWEEMAAATGDAGGTLTTLPETSQAMVVTESGTAYLEARSSTIRTTPPGTLLLIRDVTQTKVAEQTIRTLFQFMQNRDEDRTRLLLRTNAAIEVERNRISRDLHDGPVQGISAAALSVEAVRLMVEQGDIPRAAETLHKLSAELSQEAVGLRRIMSDLRPPVLEQRGLIPAVRDLCVRLQRELKIPVDVSGLSNSEVPRDVETLAYRVIQEALSNVRKHSGAGHGWLRIEATAGMLRVEIEDDGVGFEAERVRDFLHSGKVGLASMKERAELSGGTFSIRSSPGAGTTVIAALPFEILAAVRQRDDFGQNLAQA